MKRKTIDIITLGCSKNLVDSEHLMRQLEEAGFHVTHDAERPKGEIAVINTCGFIGDAKEESINMILEFAQAKEEGELEKLYVMGCLSERYLKELAIEIPQVDKFYGKFNWKELLQDLGKAYHDELHIERTLTTPQHYAYLKISEGCNQKCTFCIIPSMRGRLQSYPVSQVLSEAQRLKTAGVQELLIISQDTSAYGVDVKYQEAQWQDKSIRTRFYDLCEQLGELGIWVRLHYVYPYPHVDEIIPLMQDGKLLPYLDIPLQHANRRILKAMKRPASSENTLERIRNWRRICPELTIRSTFIVGFPGETEDEFSELLDFLREAQLDRVGCFQYSPVKGAQANLLADPVPDAVKEERYHRFMQVQAEISHQRLQAKIGSQQTVLIDSITPEHIIGRSKADAPEIDGLVYIKPYTDATIGTLVEVNITDADDYDLFGTKTV